MEKNEAIKSKVGLQNLQKKITSSTYNIPQIRIPSVRKIDTISYYSMSNMIFVHNNNMILQTTTSLWNEYQTSHYCKCLTFSSVQTEYPLLMDIWQVWLVNLLITHACMFTFKIGVPHSVSCILYNYYI